MPLKIDSALATLIPALTDEERAQLEANLKRDGCLDPVKVWRRGGDDVLLDGHNRVEICDRNNIMYEIVTVHDVKTLDDARRWVILNQFGRRNLTTFQRAELALKLKPMVAVKAKEKQRKSGGAVPQKSAKPPVETRKELAKVAGVSHDTLRKAEVIAEKADEDTKAALRRGDKGTSINKVYKEVKDREKKKPKKKLKLHPVSDAMGFSTIAISQLERIRADDAKRTAAMQRVHDWIHKNGGIGSDE